METIRKSIPLLLAFALLGSSSSKGEDRQSGVAGRVHDEASPIAAAGVYAYELADLSLHKVKTDAQGNFLFSELPAGLYKVIAHKAGFVPAVVMLTRTTAQAYQFLELELAERAPAKAAGGPASDDFWALRARIPSDVLRDMQTEEFRIAGFDTGSASDPALALSGFHTEMQAMTGMAQTEASGDGQVADGRLGIQGRLGQVQVGVSGHFWQFSPAGTPSLDGMGGGGQASALSVNLAAGDSSRISLTSLNNRLVNPNDGDGAPIDLEHYRVSWSQDVGQTGRSDFAAQYTTESNYYRSSGFEPVDIPQASRTWRVEGAYTTALGDRGTLQTGLRYRERQFGLDTARREDDPAQSSIDLFGRGGLEIRPAFLVEYGLYSTLSDGSLSLTPQGGIVLQLGEHWQAEASGRHRVYEETPVYPDFLPALYEEGDLCEQGSESCYQVRLTRKLGDENQVSISALHREVGETLRLYFSDQLMDRMESLYLVRGDQLPELQFTVTRRLSPQVLTTLQSSVASGGGGTFVSGNRQPYENQVRYMVTSLDTRFQSTSTGMFVAFHRLQQNLEPIGGPAPLRTATEYERLRLMLSQDLNILMDLAAEWTVQLNLELSRGPQQSARHDEDEMQRRFLGGIAVKF